MPHSSNHSQPRPQPGSLPPHSPRAASQSSLISPFLFPQTSLAPSHRQEEVAHLSGGRRAGRRAAALSRAHQTTHNANSRPQSERASRRARGKANASRQGRETRGSRETSMPTLKRQDSIALPSAPHPTLADTHTQRSSRKERNSMHDSIPSHPRRRCSGSPSRRSAAQGWQPPSLVNRPPAHARSPSPTIAPSARVVTVSTRMHIGCNARVRDCAAHSRISQHQHARGETALGETGLSRLSARSCLFTSTVIVEVLLLLYAYTCMV